MLPKFVFGEAVTSPFTVSDLRSADCKSQRAFSHVRNPFSLSHEEILESAVSKSDPQICLREVPLTSASSVIDRGGKLRGVETGGAVPRAPLSRLRTYF